MAEFSATPFVKRSDAAIGGSAPAAARYRFANCILDLTRGVLVVSDEEVPLRPKAFKLLLYLVENAERLVSKTELLTAVWPGISVTDESLTRCVSDVRNAVGDVDQRVIRTVPKRGYVLDEQVSVESSDRTLSGNPENHATRTPRIAVLAFDNMSGSRDAEYFSDGIAEDVITQLTRFTELSVIARNSSFTYKGRAVDVKQVGRELGVDYLLEGSVRRAKGSLRITAQLIDTATGAHCWAERYDRKLKDIFAVQDDVSRRIVTFLAAHLNKTEAGRTLLKPPTTWQAYDYFLQANEALNRYWTSFQADTLYEARNLLQKCLSLDQTYGRARGMLAYTYVNAWIVPVDSDYQKSVALDQAFFEATRAVQLDPNLPHSHACLGLVLTHMLQHDASIAAFERALALNPNHADWRFAVALVRAGEIQRATKVLEAYAALDPFYPPFVFGWLGFSRFIAGETAAALSPLRECVARAPNLYLGHLWLAAALADLNQIDDARGEIARALELAPGYSVSRSKRLSGFRQPEHAERYSGALRKAGLPE